MPSALLISAHHVARFDNCFTLSLLINNRLCQRYSRFRWMPSKKVANHIGVIKFFICHYNLEKTVALPV
jgi:hypothetical protein